MAVVSQEIVIDVPVERFFDLLVDYPRYPEFLPGMKACRVKAVRTSGEKEIDYELDVGLRRIRYTLLHREERPARIVWSLVSGELLKVSNGAWELADQEGRTRARYSMEVQITKPALIPQAIVDRVSDEMTRVQLPRTLNAFKERAEGRR
jgi:ribosome-associated toxin RatA of RatAB toxin-antitoxin module